MSIFTSQNRGMLIYSPEQSARLQYILEIIFGRMLGLEYRITHLDTEYLYEEGPKINYSFEPPEEGIFIQASGLLYERVIRDQSLHLKVFQWEGLPVFFKTDNTATLPFDVFSAAFYLVTRYEEYLPFEADEHGRFPASASIAYRESFLHLPLVHLWATELQKLIARWYPAVRFHPTAYRAELTIDIDNAWAFKNKGILNFAALFRPDEMSFRNYRYQVLSGHQPDPYDQYGSIRRVVEKYHLQVSYFFLLGRRGPFDRNISPRNRALRKLIRRLGEDADIGIHPSYASGENPVLLEEEIKSLAHILQKPVKKSRQHFIRLHMPDTYARLEALGIRDDFSMGYPDQTGYRASVGIPYPFFHLEHNRSSDLLIHPFQVMDVTLRQYLRLKPDEAIDHSRNLINQAKEAGCTFTTLWHNESLSEWLVWEGWSKVFDRIHQLAAE